jgi:hypothetical protein
MRKIVLAAMVLVVGAFPAFAQDRPVSVNFGAGVTFPVGDVASSFDAGWNGAPGVTFNISPTVGVQAEYGYHRMTGPERTITVTPGPGTGVGSNQLIEANHQIHNLSFNLVYTPTNLSGSDSPVGAYVLGGGGWYHRTIQLTSPAVGYTTICDPYWLVCYPAAVPVDRIIGDRSRDDFGFSLGGGITFGTDAKFYVEARWHYVFGKDITPDTNVNPPAGQINCSQGCSTSAQYFPITFGVRW